MTNMPDDEFNEAEEISRARAGSPPAINAPRIILVLISCFVAMHLVLQFSGERLANYLLALLAFVPARFLSPDEAWGALLPGGQITRVTSFLTYSFIHADWMHLLVNSVWMLAFGSVAARRLGTARFVLLFGCAAAVAALFSLVVNWGEKILVVGASGAISGQLAVAVRLMFSHGMNLGTALRRDISTVPPEPLAKLFTNPSALVFMGIWLGADLLVSNSGLVGQGRIAWEAHLGGFLTGLLVFSFIDPHRNRQH